MDNGIIKMNFLGDLRKSSLLHIRVLFGHVIFVVVFLHMLCVCVCVFGTVHVQVYALPLCVCVRVCVLV